MPFYVLTAQHCHQPTVERVERLTGSHFQTMCYIIPFMNKSLFRRHIALPQDHGSWVFLFSPLAIGLFTGKVFTPTSIAVIIGSVAAFLLRQPVTIAVKVQAGRRSRAELPAALLWMTLYSLAGLLALIGLLWLGFGFILILAAPALVVFAWHLLLVSRRAERGQVLVEILATGVLALAAPAAYWAAVSQYDPMGWWLWGLAWLQSAASIIYIYLRLEQRGWTSTPALRDRFKAGSNALSFAAFNLLLSLALAVLGLLPGLVFVPYLLQGCETLWGAANPAVGAKPVAIGVRQLIVSILFTILFIFVWR